jgi:iron complex transport system ATP-binding protein
MLLRVDGIQFRYRNKTLLRNVGFELASGQVLAILGPNGAGKTTLLKCINGILKPQHGQVFVENQLVNAYSRQRIAQTFAYVAQRTEVGQLSVFDTILLGRRPYIRWQVSASDLQKVEQVIESLNLEPLMLRSTSQLSGGELQKVAIARMLVQEPRILLLDEPTSALDLKNQIEILNLIRDSVLFRHCCALMTVHDLNLALRFADRFLFLKDEAIFAEGSCDCITPDIIESVYGVPVTIHKYKQYPVVIPD